MDVCAYIIPEAAWDLMEKARHACVNMKQAVVFRSDTPELGGTGSGVQIIGRHFTSNVFVALQKDDD